MKTQLTATIPNTLTLFQTTQLRRSAFFICICLLTSFNAFSQSPNFVLIVVDDQGWTGSSVQMDLSVPRSISDYYQTPEMENFANLGMVFSQAYSPASKCSPSRASFLTGRTTARNGFTMTDDDVSTDEILIEPTTNTDIDPTLTTIGEWLHDTNLGYRTAHLGKWHLGNSNEESPSENGFDVSDGNTSNNDGNTGTDVSNDPKLMFDLTTRAEAFMSEAVDDGVPFFIQISHYAVHVDVESTQATLDIYSDETQRAPGNRHDDPEYGAMTEDFDSTIGMVLDALEDLEIADNTYVFLFSDNGGPTRLTSNAPLTEGKGFILEGGIRVPFMVIGPGIQASTYEEEAVIAYDIFPTIAELTGSSLALPDGVDGASIVPLLEGNTFDRNGYIYFHSPHYDGLSEDIKPASAIVDNNYKLFVDYESGTISLFDLDDDIRENTDISGDNAAYTIELLRALRDHLKETSANLPALDPTYVGFTGTGNDVDDDGLPDDWEISEMLSYTLDGTDDPDGDGITNLDEYTNGSDPLIAANSPQTITFGTIPSQNIAENTTLTLAATSSSGLALTYASSDESIATVSGNEVTFLQPGTTNITASQPGDINYASAIDVVQTLSIDELYIWNEDSWNSGSTPAANKQLQFEDDYLITGLLESSNITISNNATLSINNEAILVSNGEIVNNGSVVVESGGAMTLLSTVSGNDFEIKRNIVANGGLSAIGSMVDGFTVGGTNVNYIYSFDGDNYSIPEASEEMVTGKGYFAGFNSASSEITFTGLPHTGNQSYVISDADKFHLIANPYTAAINRSTFVSANGIIDGTIYLWDDGGFNSGNSRTGGYITINSVGLVSGSGGLKGSGTFDGQILSGQGFFVYADQAGSLNFTPSMQSTVAGENSDDHFFRNGAIEQFSLTVSHGNTHDNMLIAFMEEASLDFDTGLDARKLLNPSLSIYGLLGNEYLVIQALPLVNHTDYTLAIGLNTSINGMHTFNINHESEHMSELSILLYDKQTDSFHDLQQSSASIELSTEINTDRFELIIAPNEVLSIAELAKPNVHAADNQVLIRKNDLQGAHQVSIFDVSGKIHFNESVVFNEGLASLPFTAQVENVYLLRVGNDIVKFIAR